MTDKVPFTTRHADRLVALAKAVHAKLVRQAAECGGRPPRPPVLRLHPHDARALCDMAAPTPGLGYIGDGKDCYGGLRIVEDTAAQRLGVK